ncbi:helix-turn-helix domain-containing protein [Sutcliffiella cohnii]|uniref:helix-turn-helix transcriptional regulator n=1 Tax=Sutcliffiella cohnii TaxID=33932 RepID=UPI002E230EBE|nr:helix-turn-helix domain-containing protein [Sutcliffiella cohnii]
MKIEATSPTKQILTAEDIASILSVSKPTAYELMRREDFPLIEIGRCKRVFSDDFFNYLSQKAAKN